MDIKDIKYISTIVEMASFSKASKKLYISQPALSQGIRRIEAELGVTLFVRDRTKVVPRREEGSKVLHQDHQPLSDNLPRGAGYRGAEPGEAR